MGIRGDDCSIQLLLGVGIRDGDRTTNSCYPSENAEEPQCYGYRVLRELADSLYCQGASRTQSVPKLLPRSAPEMPRDAHSYSTMTWVQIPFLLRDFFLTSLSLFLHQNNGTDANLAIRLVWEAEYRLGE